ncbi:DegT/DnrJ/EryC1/StrS family aminotransferase [Oceaniradius stylonematis]|uniref:DegT/DnrJ/EryC1/StrS family aminotransferase n=1 Tax=Oceaniradius stylonematis TaxID=2184161 RepID=UPI00273DBA97|nr:DegT/DnrJ/EryC1/StrS family aminotransferase [Oceaniradius stylonematis]
MQFIDLAAQQAHMKDALDRRIQTVLAHGRYIMGPEVAELEQALAHFCGARHAITCANGTDALEMALAALGVAPGDAVFVPSFTFASTAEVVPGTGAVPYFVDVSASTFNIDVQSLDRTIAAAKRDGLRAAAVIPVDLFGLPADYDAISEIASAHGLHVLADAAQSFGASYKERSAGTLGDLTTSSFFPAKPLGCYGDGGVVFTDNDGWAELIRSYRVHGKGREKYDNVRLGRNSRLDTLQAAILLEKLAHFPKEIDARQRIADIYTDALAETVTVPRVPDACGSVWAQYTLRLQSRDQRDTVRERLKEDGIPTEVYYPKPLHRQGAFNGHRGDPEGLPVSEELSETVLALPMHPYLSNDDQQRVIDALKSSLP